MTISISEATSIAKIFRVNGSGPTVRANVATQFGPLHQ
jgi:hypothetical protein